MPFRLALEAMTPLEIPSLLGICRAISWRLSPWVGLALQSVEVLYMGFLLSNFEGCCVCVLSYGHDPASYDDDVGRKGKCHLCQ